MAPQCKILNVAEKNDAARELSNVMARGRVRKREGFSKFNKIYEFDFNILGKDCHMIMTSVSGHLLSVDFILAYKNWNNCLPVSLFSADIRRFCPDNYLPIKRTLEREIQGCQHLILWTDGDREGENIADEIAHVVTQVKSRGLQVHRARFSEITPQSIMRACSNLDVLDQNMSDAVKTRQEVDLRIGCAFTRFQTKRLTKAFPHILSDQLVSYGPCQFPTLGFVVERYKQVEAFIPETFYKIKVTHDTDEGKVDFNWKRVRVFNHTVCLILYQLCLESPTAHVLSISSRPRSKWRPLPLDTVELEKLASRKLRINAKETMRIAEKLYTQGFISYPRTETNNFPDSFDLPSIIQNQVGDPQWGGFAAQLLTVGPTPRRGNKTDNAHPPIYPTKYTGNLDGNEKRIYEFVVRHFLACCSQDAKGQETTVDIDVAGEKFAATGLMIIERNYLDVYPYDRWTGKVIPVYTPNTSFQPTSIEMIEGETTPPPLLQEADLIALMEKHGIGTDATHAEHIETIKSRNYVGVQPDGSFVPGELGMGLVEGYDSMDIELSKPMLRAELETDLKRICEGRKSKDEVLVVTLEKYKEVFINASQQVQKLDEALSKYFGPPETAVPDEPAPILSEVVRKCPLCQQCDLVVKRKRDGGFMLCCLGYPECRAVQFFPSFVIDAAPHDSACNSCQPQPVHKLQLKFKAGSVPPYMGLEHIGCSTCDSTLTEDLQFRPIKSSNPNSNDNASSSSRTGRSTTAGRGARRGRQTSSVRGGGKTGTARRGSQTGSARGGSQTGSARGGGQTSNSSRGPSNSSSNWDHNFQSSHQTPFSNQSSSSGYGTSTTMTRSALSTTGNQITFNGQASSGSNYAHSDPDNIPHCNCGEVAVLLTVRREDSVNKGRQFYKCSQREGGCDFFLWADAAPVNTTSNQLNSTFNSSRTNHHYSSTTPVPSRAPGMLSDNRRGGQRGRKTSSNRNSSSQFGGSDSNQTVMCNCGSEAVQRTVQKDGPNKGRHFFTCFKPRDDQCGFFEWADDVPASNVRSASNRGRGRGRGREQRVTRGDELDGGRRKRAPPTCSVCRQPGHTKRSCPQTRDLS